MVNNSLYGCSQAARDFLDMLWKELCPTPKGLHVCRRATAVTSRLSLRVAGNLHVRANFVGKKKEKKLTEICEQKLLN